MSAQANGEDGERHAPGAGQYDGQHERYPERHAKLGNEQRGGVGADAVERRVTEVKLTGIAENKIETDGQHDVDRANDQVRAPIRILKDERQNRNEDDDPDAPAAPSNPAPLRSHGGRRVSVARHFLHASRRSGRSAATRASAGGA